MVRFKNQNVAETRARNELYKFSFEIVGILKIYDDHVDENVNSNFALIKLSFAITPSRSRHTIWAKYPVE